MQSFQELTVQPTLAGVFGNHFSSFPSSSSGLAIHSLCKHCASRQQIVAEILQTPALELEVNARKLRQLARDDPEQAARDGTTGLLLYIIILGLRRMAKSDIQCLEGVNSMVKVHRESCAKHEPGIAGQQDRDTDASPLLFQVGAGRSCPGPNVNGRLSLFTRPPGSTLRMQGRTWCSIPRHDLQLHLRCLNTGCHPTKPCARASKHSDPISRHHL